MAGKGRKPFWDDRREQFAIALARGVKAEEAGKVVGYSPSNSRRNAQRADVKARVTELRAPIRAKVQDDIEFSLRWTLDRLKLLAARDFHPDEIEPHHVVAALRLAAQINGWLAPEKVDATVSNVGLGERIDQAFARITAHRAGG